MSEALKDFVKAFGAVFLVTYATICTAIVSAAVLIGWIKYVQA